MQRDRVVVRLFGRFIRLVLPDSLVESHGEAQLEAFRDLHAEARERGVVPVGRLLLRESIGLVSTAIRERRVTGGDGMGNNTVPEGRDSWMQDISKDLAVALRTLRKAPGYSAIVMLILALGIAATSSVFTVVNGVLFRPLPYESSGELVLVWSELDRSTDPSSMTVSPADFLSWQESATSFETLAAHNLWFPVLSGDEGDAQSIMAGLVTPDLFTVLGVRPLLGRTFRPEESDGTHRVTVLSYGLWRGRFGADPTIVGRDIRLNGLPYEVVGVLPADYRHPDPHRPLAETQLFRPFDMSEWGEQSGSRYLRVFGRMAEGVSVERAQSEMDAVAMRLEALRPDTNRDVGSIVLSMRDQFYESSRAALMMVLAGAGLLFIIVCANVANLVLTRSLGRRREFAVRASLGAGRTRIARQILVENGLLALGGSAMGLTAVVVSLDLLRGMQGRFLPTVGDIRLDLSVLAFSIGLAMVTTLVLGVLPLGELFRTPVRTVLTEESGGTGGSRKSQRMRAMLVVGEVALAAALVVGAGLLGRSFQRLSNVGPGFDAPAVLTAEITAPRDRYETSVEFVPMYEELASRLSALPGVTTVSYASQLPLLDGNWSRNFDVVDQPREEIDWHNTEMRFVGPQYFQAMGIELASGREFESGDRKDAPLVVIVNQTLARRHWAPGEALGKFVRWRASEEIVTAEVVGVVGDVLDDALTADPDPFMYYPFAQSPNRSAAFAIRTAGDPSALIGSVRETIRALDPGLPLDVIESYQSRIRETIAAPRFASTLASVFSLLALAIAGLGIYGVVSYAVGARTREIGIRAALGASRGDVASMVVRQSMALTVIGVGLGLGLAVIEGRVLMSLLFETSTGDPLAYLLAPAALLVVALVASYLPARRALAVEPVQALRADGR